MSNWGLRAWVGLGFFQGFKENQAATFSTRGRANLPLFLPGTFSELNSLTLKTPQNGSHRGPNTVTQSIIHHVSVIFN